MLDNQRFFGHINLVHIIRPSSLPHVTLLGIPGFESFITGDSLLGMWSLDQLRYLHFDVQAGRSRKLPIADWSVGGDALQTVERLVDEALDLRGKVHSIDTLRPSCGHTCALAGLTGRLERGCCCSHAGGRRRLQNSALASPTRGSTTSPTLASAPWRCALPAAPSTIT